MVEWGRKTSDQGSSSDLWEAELVACRASLSLGCTVLPYIHGRGAQVVEIVYLHQPLAAHYSVIRARRPACLNFIHWS